MTDYDSFAKAYSAENETGLFTAHYERPAMLRLAGDVSGAMGGPQLVELARLEGAGPYRGSRIS